MDEIRFQEQLTFRPALIGPEVPSYSQIVIGGMGGSGFPGRALSFLDPTTEIILHSDYGVPPRIKDRALYIAISYSGNTGETLSFANGVLEQHQPLAVVTAGGALLALAKEKNLPYVLVPEGLQPRDALLFLLRGLLVILGNNTLLDQIEKAQVELEVVSEQGVKLGEKFHQSIPLIYTSVENAPIGYLWKTLLNESAKILAFNNVFPELTHNELQSLNYTNKVFVLRGNNEDTHVGRQIDAFVQLASTHDIEVTIVELLGDRIERLIHGWILARSFAHAIAKTAGIDPNAVPLIEAFKKEL